MRLLITLFATILLTPSCSKEDANPLTIPVVWQKEISNLESSRFFQDPIIFRDYVIYPLEKYEDYVGQLIAYDKNTGEKIWEWQEAFDQYGEDGFNAKSYVYQDILICGWNNLSYGINLNNGQTVWKEEGNINSTGYYCGLDQYAYSYDSEFREKYNVKQTNVTDGTYRYLYSFLKNDEFNAYMGLPYAFEWEGISYVTFITGKWKGVQENYFLNLYNLNNDEMAWTTDTIPLQVPLSGIPGLRPQFSDGKILLANDAIYSYNLDDGALEWRADYGNTFVLNSHITAADGKVWGNNDSGFCVGLDVNTGLELFNTTTGGSTTRILYHDNKIYLGSVDSFEIGHDLIMVLDAETGRVLKNVKAPYYLENKVWKFNKEMEIDPETGLLYTGDHRYAMCIDPWK